MASQPKISLRDVHYSYPDGTVALRGVSLDIFKGDIVGVIGNNGSGKTTLVKHFNGLLKPTEGKVFVDGVETAKQTMVELSSKVGYVFQNPNLQIFSSRIEDELLYGPKNIGMSEKETKEGVASALKMVGLEGREEDNPFFLPIGIKQRISIASSLIMRPEILIVDEPTTGQDVIVSKRMMELLKELNETRDHTIIIITHDLWIVAEYTKRTIIMNEGKVSFDGPTKEAFTEAEIFERAGLEPPQIVELSQKLKGYGLSVALSPGQMCKRLDKVLIKK